MHTDDIIKHSLLTQEVRREYFGGVENFINIPLIQTQIILKRVQYNL